jgi:hypothetical protein
MENYDKEDNPCSPHSKESHLQTSATQGSAALFPASRADQFFYSLAVIYCAEINRLFFYTCLVLAFVAKGAGAVITAASAAHSCRAIIRTALKYITTRVDQAIISVTNAYVRSA